MPLKDYLSIAGYAGDQDFDIAQPDETSLRKHFEWIERKAQMPSETEINQILREKMGKTKPSDRAQLRLLRL